MILIGITWTEWTWWPNPDTDIVATKDLINHCECQTASVIWIPICPCLILPDAAWGCTNLHPTTVKTKCPCPVVSVHKTNPKKTYVILRSLWSKKFANCHNFSLVTFNLPLKLLIELKKLNRQHGDIIYPMITDNIFSWSYFKIEKAR